MKIKFVAEIGLNHNGNFDLCFELIKKAKQSGADIVKFQLGWRGKVDQMNYINDIRLQKLFDWANFFDVEIMFSVIDFDSLKMLNKFDVKKYKIASRTLKENFKLVEEIVSLNKDTYISLGMTDFKYFPFDKDNVKYLWCKSEYPNDINEVLNFPSSFLDSKFYGLSDHFIGIEASLIAITRGACLIEKHFTLDKSDFTIRDNALSATPDEFKLLVDQGRIIHKMLFQSL